MSMSIAAERLLNIRRDAAKDAHDWRYLLRDAGLVAAGLGAGFCCKA